MPDPLHLHLLSDSTGETLELIAKACLAQFDHVEVLQHLWPMVRSEGHLDRVLDDIERRPGLVLFTLVNSNIIRKRSVFALIPASLSGSRLHERYESSLPIDLLQASCATG